LVRTGSLWTAWVVMLGGEFLLAISERRKLALNVLCTRLRCGA
jgi:hypothetical protein